MDSGLNLTIRSYYFSQSEALKPRLIVFASKRQKSIESISSNTSPTPICQPISCLISTFISCWFYKPRLWSFSNIFRVMFLKYILGWKFEMNLGTRIELKECFSICFVVKNFSKFIEKSSWNSRLAIFIWIIKTFKAYGKL